MKRFRKVSDEAIIPQKESGRETNDERVIDIRRADRVEKGEFVVVPQGGMGVLLAHEVTETRPVDGGKFTEIATDDGLKHLIGKDVRVVVIF